MACAGLSKLLDSLSVNLSHLCNEGRCCTSACCGGQVIVAERREIPAHLQQPFTEAANRDDLQEAIDRVPSELQKGERQIKGKKVSPSNLTTLQISEGIVAFTTKALDKLREGVSEPNEDLRRREIWVRLHVAEQLSRVDLQQKLRLKEPLTSEEASGLINHIRLIRRYGSQAARIWKVFQESRPSTIKEFQELRIENEAKKALSLLIPLEKDQDVKNFCEQIITESFYQLSRDMVVLFLKSASELHPNGFVSWLSVEEIAEIGLGKSPRGLDGRGSPATPELVRTALKASDDGAGVTATGMGSPEINIGSPELEVHETTQEEKDSCVGTIPFPPMPTIEVLREDDPDGINLTHRAAEGALEDQEE